MKRRKIMGMEIDLISYKTVEIEKLINE